MTLRQLLDEQVRRVFAENPSRATVEYPFGTLKAWIGATHFKTRTR